MFNIFTMESGMSSFEEDQIDLVFSTEKVPGHSVGNTSVSMGIGGCFGFC